MRKTLQQAQNWFIERGIYNIVCERISERRAVSFEEMYRREGGNVLNAGITWAQTPEGSNYWNNIHDKFTEWYQADNIPKPKLLFKIGQKVKIKKVLSSEVVEINEEMLNLSGKIATIASIDPYGYEHVSKDKDGGLYYINEDNTINSWTSELLTDIKK